MDLIKRVIYEDNHIIIINKIPGELVQSDKTGDTSLSDLIKNYLKIKNNKPGSAYLGLVHRLDRPTSGVLVFAKTSKALARLNNQFKLRLTKKIYWALVDKKIPKNYTSLSNWMTRNRKKNKCWVQGILLYRCTGTILLIALSHGDRSLIPQMPAEGQQNFKKNYDFF